MTDVLLIDVGEWFSGRLETCWNPPLKDQWRIWEFWNSFGKKLIKILRGEKVERKWGRILENKNSSRNNFEVKIVSQIEK